jgi:lipoate-protein ligase A
MNWSVQRVSSSVEEVHSRDLQADRALFVIDAPGTALVLGSRQRPELLGKELVNVQRCRERGVDVVVRRSGGGIVYLEESQYLWVDVVIARGDPLWSEDVARSMHWLGAAWREALQNGGIDSCSVHHGPLMGGALGALVCFASVGPGEVVDASGAKLVGIAQRRTSEHARFQCIVLRRWNPAALVDLLVVHDDPLPELQRVARGVDVEPDALLGALVDALPQ